MTIKYLRQPVAVLLAALMLFIGCARDGNDGNNDSSNPVAVDQAEPSGDEKPPAELTPPDRTLARAEEPGLLKPLVLPPEEKTAGLSARLTSDAKQTAKEPDEKDTPGTLRKLPHQDQPPLAMLKDDEPLKRAPDQAKASASAPANSPASLPESPAGKNMSDVLHGKTISTSDDLRTNPLRSNQFSTGLKNPMRQGAANSSRNIKPNGPFQAQPVAGMSLPAESSEQKPTPQQPLSAKSLIEQPARQLPASDSQQPVVEHAMVGKSKKDAAAKFDPIEENGSIFEGWKKPKLAILISGREDGYLEPCGCAGLDRMKGGLSRRHTMIEQLLAKGWPLLRVDVGGLSKGYGVQAELKFQITVDAMKKMGYQAIGFSPNDLRLPVDSLVAVADNSDKKNPSPFVSANVGLLGFEAEITAPWRIVEVGGYKIGVTSVLDTEFQKDLVGGDIEFVSPEEAIKRVLPKLKKHCSLMVLLAYANQKRTEELSQKFPEFCVVVSAVGPATPPIKPTVVDDSLAVLIDVGEKGMDAVVLGLYEDRDKPYEYQRVPLDSRFPASKDMKLMMKAYQEQLGKLGLAGLAIKPVSHPAHDVNGEFVGSKACQNCHEPSYDVWKKSGHAKAWSTLLHADPPRNNDPECISCHVIGWHPTKHFPYKSGFLSEKLTPKMLDVGCESCHGPGETHVKAEMGNDKALQLRMQKAVRITKEEAKNNYEKGCHSCHDLDNSPDFNFESYWPKVEHTESE
ncbi:MAG: hypothetical protein JXM70_04660 [Pirellulales bacterium]|nr:hypothetical protein [Pirellulales bacterium]